MASDRRRLRRRLYAAASGQGGYFTASEAKAIGYSYQAQAYHVRVGNWIRVDRGLFRLPEWVPDVHDDLIRWTLWSDRQGVVSHETALAAHGVGEFESARVHLTVPTRFRKRDAALSLHRGELPADDIVAHPGFMITKVVRSLVDVAHSTDEDQLARAIAEAQAAGQLTARELRARAEAVDARSALHIERALQGAEARP